MLKATKTVTFLLAVAVTSPRLSSAQTPPIPALPEAPEAPAAPMVWAVATQAPPAEPEAPAPPAAPRAPGKPAKPAAPGTPAPVAPAPPPPPEPPVRVPVGERVNVRVDLRLKVLSGGNVVTEKPLTVLSIGDGSKTGIRSQSNVLTHGGGQTRNEVVGLNADVRATVDGKRILLGLTLSYTILAPATSPDQLPPVINMNNDIRTVLDDGKALVISEQVDAATDYRLVVEAKATILR